jgi:hypothetical protein
VVDEIAYQPRRGLGQHALADAIPFTRADEARIRRGGIAIAAGRMPNLPPRFQVSASRYALEAGAEPDAVSKLVIGYLACRQADRSSQEQPTPIALVA